MTLKLGSACVFTPTITPVNLSLPLSTTYFYSTILFKGWSHCCLDTMFSSVGQILLTRWIIVMQLSSGVYVEIINNRLVISKTSMMHHWQNYSLLNCSKLRIGEHLPLHKPADKVWINYYRQWYQYNCFSVRHLNPIPLIRNTRSCVGFFVCLFCFYHSLSA